MATTTTTRDIEGDEFEDLVDVPEPLEFWKKKQREIVTSVVDYNLSTLADLVQDGAIDANPAYQRRNRWDDERSSKLIESFLMNVLVPPVFLNEGEFGHCDHTFAIRPLRRSSGASANASNRSKLN